MSTTTGTFEQVARAMIDVLAPLRRALGSADAFQAFMLRLGWETTAIPPAYTVLGTTIAEAIQAVEALRDDASEREILTLLDKAKAAYQAIRRIDQAPPGVDVEAFLREIGERLFEVLLTDYLSAHQPTVFNLLSILNVIETENIPATAHQRGHIRTHFHWGNIPDVIRDPLSLPEKVYGWGTQDLRFQLLLQHLSELLFAFGFPVYIGKAEEFLTNGYVGRDVDLDEDSQWLKVPFYYITIADRELEAAISVVELKGDGNTLPGLALQPHIPSEFPLTLHLAPTIDLRVRAGTNAGSQLGIVLRPGEASIKYPFQPGTTPPSAGIGIGFDFKPPSPTVLFGSPQATRLELQGASVDLGASSVDNELDIRLAAQLNGLALVLQPGEADSFLHNLLGDSERRLAIPLGIEWTRRNGVRFAGSSAFEVAVHLHQRIGPIVVEGITLRLFAPSDHSADLTVAVGAIISGQLGPVAFTVEGLGFLVNATFSPGNVGPFDLDLGFKPPTGLGVVIDTPLVVGGGYLFFDPAQAEYGGILQLEVAETIAVKAIGLLTTRLPGGAKGYSLLILISAEGFAPIQLGLGFTLTGIGGLLGVNRTARVDVLRNGLKQGTLGSILFPQDPIRNAPQIVSDLRAVFPPAPGRFLFGPMAIIGWGTPTILTLELALILELPAPVRLIILGRLLALLPDEAHALVRVRMDAIGVIDFNKGEISLDAVLYDSRILAFTLTGEMALRASWGAQPRFVLAIGGFHPRFAAPADFPKLKRLALNISDSDSLRLRCDAYLALTSNTVQFGARVELHAAGGGFSFDGYLGFDALFQFSPFAFVVDLAAGIALRYHGRLLMGIHFEGRLSGPTPWQIQGKATIKIWFFKVTVDFKRQFGPDVPPPVPAPIEVGALVLAAVQDARNWSGTLPRGEHPLVTLRDRAGSGTPLFVHPLAEVTVRQRIVPLNRTIDKVGSAPVRGARQFTLHAIRADQATGALPLATTPVHEAFALAQYQEMSDEAKLSRPSFESQEAGLRLGTETVAYAYDPVVDDAITYETELVVPGQGPEPEPEPTAPPRTRYTMTAAVLDAVVGTGAAGQAAIRRRGRTRHTVGKLVA